MNRIQDLQKLIKLTGDREKLDAKASGIYIVYKTKEEQFVKEYSNGNIEQIEKQNMSEPTAVVFFDQTSIKNLLANCHQLL